MYTKREWWMIEKLDADPREPYDALAVQSFQEEFPELYRDLRTINRRAFIVSAATLGFIILNFILSAVLVLRPFPTGYYDGPRTFTGLITNTLLVVIQIKARRGPKDAGPRVTGRRCFASNAAVRAFLRDCAHCHTMRAERHGGVLLVLEERHGHQQQVFHPQVVQRRRQGAFPSPPPPTHSSRDSHASLANLAVPRRQPA